MNFSFRHLLILLGILAGPLGMHAAHAQPSDAKITKDLTSPGVLSIKLLGTGSRVWSKTFLQYFWERGAVLVRNAGLAEYPNVKVEIGGTATYSIVGGNFAFKKFYVAYNTYHGMPNPNSKEILDLLNTDRGKFLGHYYNSIVGDIKPIALAADPKWEWHTPNSVSFLVTTGFDAKVDNTTLEKKAVAYEVRLYRDKIKGPWLSFFSQTKSETSQGKTTHDADDLRAMKTLSMVDAERIAAKALDTLPDVEIPAFKTDLEAFTFLHETLRAGDAKKGEAVLRRMLAPIHFENGSTVLLNARGEEIVQATVKTAFKGKSLYADQYGPELNVREYQNNSLVFWNADGRHFSRIALVPAGGTWENGVKVGQTLRIADISLWVATDADEIARLNSMPPATRFAPPAGSKPFSSLGRQVAAQQQVAAQTAEVAAIKWTPFTSTNARLSIAFAGTPKETEGKMNGKYPMWTVESTENNLTCRAVAIIYPTRLNRMQAQTVVESTLQQLAAANNTELKKIYELNQGTFGRTTVLEIDGTIVKARAFVQGDVLYQLILGGPAATVGLLNERDFFGTFRAG